MKKIEVPLTWILAILFLGYLATTNNVDFLTGHAAQVCIKEQCINWCIPWPFQCTKLCNIQHCLKVSEELMAKVKNMVEGPVNGVDGVIERV